MGLATGVLSANPTVSAAWSPPADVKPARDRKRNKTGTIHLGNLILTNVTIEKNLSADFTYFTWEVRISGLLGRAIERNTLTHSLSNKAALRRTSCRTQGDKRKTITRGKGENRYATSIIETLERTVQSFLELKLNTVLFKI